MVTRILRSILILLSLAEVLQAYAHDFIEPNDDGVEIYYNILSSEQKTVAVTFEEGRSAYYSYGGVTAIKVPGTVTHEDVTYEVTEIGNYAFFECSSLTSVTFPESIQKIGEYSFCSCSLTELNLPSSVKEIGDYAFYGCSQLTEVIFPNSLSIIGDYAFYGCTQLTEVIFPNSLSIIGDFAFKGTAITGINYFPSLKTIGEGAFMDCEKLEYAYIPPEVTEIGGGAFAGCMMDLRCYSSGFKVQDGALYDANMDTLICYFGRRGGEFVVPDGVKAVKPYAFFYNKNLTRIILPNSVEEANGIVEYSTKLEYLKLPDIVSHSGLSGFEHNIALKEVVIPQNITKLEFACFYQCAALQTINLPEGLEYIGGASLRETNLKTIHIPSTVKTISYDAFGSFSLKTVYCDITDIASVTYFYDYGGILPDNFTIFGYDDVSDAVLVVPEGTVEEYKKQSNWNKFGVITDNTHSFTMEEDMILNTKNINPITVSMTNPSDIIAFQADIILPEGVTIPRDEEGELKINLTSRADKTHTVSAEMNGNVVKMVVVSIKNASFKEQEGPLFTFDVEVTGDVNESTIEVNNIILSERGNIEHYLPPIWETYTVRNYTPGDTNEDGRVAVGDITCVIDHVVGREVEPFSASAADMNGDGNITIGDITMLIDMTLSSVEQTAAQLCAKRVNESGNTAEQPTEFFSFAPVTGETGKTATLNVDFTNTTPFIAFQADIVLPEGVTIENDEYGDPNIYLSERAADHFVSARMIAENTCRMVVVSMKNRQFKGNEGTLFSCPLKLDCPVGEYEVQLKKLIISIPGNTEIDCPDFTGQLTVSLPTSITDTLIGTVADGDIYYNLQGVRVYNPTGGVYIRIRDGHSSTVLVK